MSDETQSEIFGDGLYQKLKEAFDTYKTTDTFFITSDLQLFTNEDNANFHGSKQTDKGVAAVTREQFEALGEPPVGEPPVGEPVVGEPVVGEPPVGEPVVGEPVVGEPVVGEPVVGEPVVGEPVVGDSSLAHPETSTILDAAEVKLKEQADEAAVTVIDAALNTGAVDAKKKDESTIK